MPNIPLAELYFESCRIEGELDDALMSAFGANPEDTETWPAGDCGYDPYDFSFELWGTKNDFIPTDAQLDAVWALGFAQGWICYSDGTEVYVRRPHTRGARKPSRHGVTDMKRIRHENLHRALRDEALLRRYLDNHCQNADREGMSTLCECRLCLDTRQALEVTA